MIENRFNGHLPPITAYDAIQNVPKCDIAWEFLRRNTEYGRDVECFGSDAIIRDRDWHGWCLPLSVWAPIVDCRKSYSLGGGWPRIIVADGPARGHNRRP